MSWLCQLAYALSDSAARRVNVWTKTAALNPWGLLACCRIHTVLRAAVYLDGGWSFGLCPVVAPLPWCPCAVMSYGILNNATSVPDTKNTTMDPTEHTGAPVLLSYNKLPMGFPLFSSKLMSAWVWSACCTAYVRSSPEHTL